MGHAEAALDFRVPANPQFSRIVRESTTNLARAHGVDGDDFAQFLTALGEAVANAIEHAKADRPIEIEVRISLDRIVGIVRDEGVGFSSSKGALAVDLPPGDAERGRGLPIMRRCSDIFSVESVPGGGTAVIVGRFLRDRSAPRAANVA